MKILVTGAYETDYNRTMVILSGLRKRSDVELVEFPYPSRRKVDKCLLKDECDAADFVFIPSFMHADVRFIKRLTDTLVVFDPLISRYLTKVFDYKQVWRYSPRALKNFYKDKIAMGLADIVFCDTNAHREYFEKTIGIDRSKMHVLPVGINTDDFMPIVIKVDQPKKFKVGFYGKFIPLQGADKIVEAARILREEDIVFEMIGEGVEFPKVKKLALEKHQLTNINFHGNVPYDQLNTAINQFDICLGIFGGTEKANLVIPNKVYHYAGIKKPIITQDSVGVREIFTHEENIILSSTNPEDIARQILRLQADKELSDKIANNAYSKISEEYNEVKIAEMFMKALG